MAVHRQLPRLATLVVGEENKAPLIDSLQQHDASGGFARRVRRRQHHGVRLVCSRGERLVEPVAKLLQWIGGEVRFP